MTPKPCKTRVFNPNAPALTHLVYSKCVLFDNMWNTTFAHVVWQVDIPLTLNVLIWFIYPSLLLFYLLSLLLLFFLLVFPFLLLFSWFFFEFSLFIFFLFSFLLLCIFWFAISIIYLCLIIHHHILSLHFLMFLRPLCHKKHQKNKSINVYTGCLLGLGTRLEVGFLIQVNFMHTVYLD